MTQEGAGSMAQRFQLRKFSSKWEGSVVKEFECLPRGWHFLSIDFIEMHMIGRLRHSIRLGRAIRMNFQLDHTKVALQDAC
jgi:hypothetical protein